MAVGATQLPEMFPVPGIEIGTVCAGIKQIERDDVVLVQLVEGATCAAVFTQNAFCAAPVQVAKANLANAPRWLLINSGNANAGTGEQGMEDALLSCYTLAEMAASEGKRVMPFSTGVIGEKLPIEKIQAALPRAFEYLDEQNWAKAARAIMTTDTFAKGASKIIEINGETITLNGIAKGAGMIQPNMATMLGFIGTDAKIAQPLLQQCLQQAADQSFNRITVDGDTSTNDACVLMASGRSAVPELKEGSAAYRQFADAVMEMAKHLAELIVRDGEGATKFIRILVKHAASEAEAVDVAKTIAHSPLVKTAFFASDPNWGRILAAVGRAGVQQLDLNKVEIYLNEVCIVSNGGRAADYTEQQGQQVMSQEEITITVVLGRGEVEQQVLTCDFSYDYVRINAEYRT